MLEKDYLILCGVFCRFYKPFREQPRKCFGFDILKKLIETKKIEFNNILEISIENFRNMNNELLGEIVCIPCPFRIEGCDFRDNAVKGKHPCGGYAILDILLESGRLHHNDLRKPL